MDMIEQLFTVSGHSEWILLFGRQTNSSGGREVAVTPRVRIDWARFKQCRELLLGNRFSLRMKGKFYHCCVRSAVLYGSEAWCLKETKKKILRRTERAMGRAK